MNHRDGRAALTIANDGSVVDPSTIEDWDAWVSASRTRNWLEDDPLLDWLDRYGPERGYVPDNELETYDPRTDMRAFVLERGIAFEDSVLALLRDRVESVRVAEGPADGRDLDLALRTVELMRMGTPVIEQAVLRNPQDQTFGVADLLVRADALDLLVPGAISSDEAHVPAPGLDRPWHYRVVDIKLRTLRLLADGHAGSNLTHFAVQVWIYGEALRRIQGVATSGFLLGRAWTQGISGRGDGCFDRLARVDHDRVGRDGVSFAELAEAAVHWIRRVRSEGARWQVLPTPSVAELYPHARNREDQPWHWAKRQIAAELRELTLLPGMNPARRNAAHSAGLRGWDDPAVSSATLAVPRQYAAQCDAVLAVNRDEPGSLVVPDRIRHSGEEWRWRPRVEFFVDFETVSNLADDFSRLPAIGGQPLIFQIGCGLVIDGRWEFAQWTAERLREPNEGVIIGRWVDYMAQMLLDLGLTWEQARVIHWSAAEPTSFDNAYNAARDRHPENGWPGLPWFDFLQAVIRTEPVAIRGAFDFGLKSIANAMRVAGLIESTWGDGPVDGLGAMVGAWWCDAEAARTGVGMSEIELMGLIARYNEIDCRTMSDVVSWLRDHR